MGSANELKTTNKYNGCKQGSEPFKKTDLVWGQVKNTTR